MQYYYRGFVEISTEPWKSLNLFYFNALKNVAFKTHAH